jgi:hypothetical protein
MGMLVGPLIAALFMAMVRIYRRDFLGITQPAVIGPPFDPPPARTSPSIETAPVLASSVLDSSPGLSASPVET